MFRTDMGPLGLLMLIALATGCSSAVLSGTLAATPGALPALLA